MHYCGIFRKISDSQVAITLIIPEDFEVPIFMGTMAATSLTSPSSQEPLPVSQERGVEEQAGNRPSGTAAVAVCSCW